jgi:choline dehydrogenase-like flavoprotein
MQIVRPLMVGGATSMYCGCAALPPAWLKQRYGVDIDADVAAPWHELGVAPLAPELRGPASTRIAQAAQALGYAWEPQAKLMAPGRSFNCGAHCMLGCRCGAKWSAASFVDQASGAGATLITSANVQRVLIDGRRAVGVAGRIGRESFVARADTVVLAAGGIGTPRILANSGVAAGAGLTVDTTLMVYGATAQPGIGHEPPMTWAWHNLHEGYMLSTLIDPWLMYPLAVVQAGAANTLSWPKWGNMLGVMIKIKDDVNGLVAARSISKPATAGDRERIANATAVARRILREAGVAPGSEIVTGLRGTHPASTVRIGELVGTQLETALAGLYVCDASVFPEALARPTVLTIIGLAKRLARHLTGAQL